MQEPRKMELSLPAGSPAAAISAFDGGADSVYLGMKAFSARRGAVNFTFDDLSRLMALAGQSGKKVYVTINTIVYDEELQQVFSLLRRLDFLGIDGVIVQDLGVAALIRRYFPSLPLHASTQLAVHTPEGVRFLQERGFSRVVLARELSLPQIKAIRLACPDVELKVFIHGAMCYGFSGLCQASRIITGRSANRGECAQICRTWFSCPAAGRDGYFFSMKDLCAGERVLALRDMGIESVKVEGRMKSPQYTRSVARYYRLLLDGETDASVLSRAAEDAAVAFLRPSGDGYLTGGTGLVDPDNTQHWGIRGGTVLKVMGDEVRIRAEHDLSLRDGLLFSSGDIHRPEHPFSLMDIEDAGMRKRSFVRCGETFTTTVPSDCRPKEGCEVRIVSLHDSGMKQINTDALRPRRRPVDLALEIGSDYIKISCDFGGRTIRKDFPVQVRQAVGDRDFSGVIRTVFGQSGESLFTLGQAAVDISRSGFSNVFIPVSQLKEIRRQWYRYLDDEAREYFDSPMPAPGPLGNESKPALKLPPRRLLGLWDKTVEIDGTRYLPLCPVITDEEALYERLEKLVKEDPDLVIGLNNPAHIRWAQRHPRIRTFADVYLYLANSEAAREICRTGGGICGGYFFQEGSANGRDFGNWPFVPSDASDFRGPLFISLAGSPLALEDGQGTTLLQNSAVYTLRREGKLTLLCRRD